MRPSGHPEPHSDRFLATVLMLVSTDHLSKSYGRFQALTDCSLAVTPGEVFGLLGPNGAGKSTLLRLLLGFTQPSAGSAQIAGHDCHTASQAVRRNTAYLPGEARLFRRMRGSQVLDFFADLRPECNRERATRIADRLDLDCRRQVARMSTGMRQKLALAMVLAIDCPLIILDEPTANLDPTARAEVLDLVQEARQAGRTVIFSSHVLSEIEATCDRVVILRAGRLVHEQSIAHLRQRHRISARLSQPLGAIPAGLAESVTVLRQADGQVVLEAADSLTGLLGWLAGLPLSELRIEPVGLAVVYDQYHRNADANGRPATDAT